MTKKHFIALAASLKATKPPKTHRARLEAWKATVSEVACTCNQFNSMFDHSRFLDACGYDA